MRINALGNTATDFASDDYISLDGTTNGSRKMKNDSLLNVTAQNDLSKNFGKIIVSAPKTTFLKLDTEKNMIDVKTSIKDYLIRGKDSDGDRGTIRYFAGFSCTDFIPVEAGENYYADFTYVSSKSYAFYDKDFNWISGANAGADDTALTSPFTAPVGACWVRVSYPTTNENRVWISSVNGTHRQEEDPSLTEEAEYETEGIVTSEKEFNKRFDTRVKEYLNNFESTSFDKKNPKVLLSLDVNSKWKTENCSFTRGFKYNNIIKKTLPVISVTTGTETNAYVWCDLDSYVDATTYPLQIIVNSSELDDTSVFNGLQIEAYSEGYTDSNHRIRCFIQYEQSTTLGYNTDFVRNGWFNLCYNLKATTTSANTGANFDFTKVSRIGVKIFKVNGNVRHIDIARLAFVYPMKRAGVITIVDNFNVSVPTMADYAYSKGVRLNLSIVPGFYDGDPQAPVCASIDELRRVAQQGHFIFNHTYRHLNFNDLTDAEIAEEIILSEKWMQNNGFAYGKKFISIPSARFNTNSCNSTLESNADSIFHTWSLITNNAKKVIYPYYPCTRCLDQSNLDSTFGSDVNKAIDNVQAAIDYNGIAVIGFHGTYWTLYNNGEKWKQYIDAISVMDLYHYGIDELVEGNYI